MNNWFWWFEVVSLKSWGCQRISLWILIDRLWPTRIQLKYTLMLVPMIRPELRIHILLVHHSWLMKFESLTLRNLFIDSSQLLYILHISLSLCFVLIDDVFHLFLVVVQYPYWYSLLRLCWWSLGEITRWCFTGFRLKSVDSRQSLPLKHSYLFLVLLLHHDHLCL